MFDETTSKGVVYSNLSYMIAAVLMFIIIRMGDYLVTNILSIGAFILMVGVLILGGCNIMQSKSIASQNAFIDSDDDGLQRRGN